MAGAHRETPGFPVGLSAHAWKSFPKEFFRNEWGGGGYDDMENK